MSKAKAKIENPKCILNCDFDNGHLLINPTVKDQITVSVNFTNEKLLEAMTDQFSEMKIELSEEQEQAFKDKNFLTFESHALDWLKSKDDRIKSYEIKEVKRNGKRSWTDAQIMVENNDVVLFEKMVNEGLTDDEGNPYAIKSEKYGWLILCKDGLYKKHTNQFATKADKEQGLTKEEMQENIQSDVAQIMAETLEVLDETETLTTEQPETVEDVINQ